VAGGLAFRALPLVLVISALSALLFHWRVLPAIVRGLSFLLEKLMGVGGAVGLSTGANVFVGMVEAPLFIRPYLAKVSRGELFAIMAGGMASIAGTVLFLYGTILRPALPDAVAHLLIASILSAPAALVIAFMMVPPQGAATGGSIELQDEASGSMDALTRGTLEGAQLLLNIVAMLVVFVALVALVNLGLNGCLTYALCGFANFGSLGIMIGGLGTMCPGRRSEIVALGMKSIVAGTLATCLTAATVGLIL
jgi:CNT family concentrative nucleoside transporter